MGSLRTTAIWGRGLAAGMALWLAGCPSQSTTVPPKPGPTPNSTGKSAGPLDEATSQRLVELKNLGLGALENHQFDKATQLFDEILTAVPEEPFAIRNRCIALVKLATEGIDERAKPSESAQALKAAEQAVTRLEVQEKSSGLPEFFRAVLATKTGNPREIAHHLQAATERDPDNVPWKFQWYELGRSLRDPVEKTAALNAGLSAAALAPDNLFVQKEVLAENLSILADLAKQAPNEAKAQADDILRRLEKLREPLRVLGVSIQVQAKIDVVTVLDGVLAHIRHEQWQLARNEFFKIKNLLSQETASDADLIHPHPLTYHDPLNYVALDLSARFYQRATLPSDDLPKINITWKSVETDLPKPRGTVRQLDWLDFDLDGKDDLVVLTEGQLEVHCRMTDGQGWQTTSLATGGDFTGFVSADLDDDVQEAGGEGKPAEFSARSHDADADFILFGPTGMLAVNNRGEADNSRRVLEPAANAGNELTAAGPTEQVKLVDFDHDGDLDLVTVVESRLRLWLNRGNFSFREVSSQSLMPPTDWPVAAVDMLDWDRDNDVDLLVAGPNGIGWMENLRHGRMRFRPLPKGMKAPQLLQVVEWNSDGNWDLLTVGRGDANVATGGFVNRVLTQRAGPASPEFTDELALMSGNVQSVRVIDFDNDGGLDVCVNGANLWRNNGRGQFAEVPEFASRDESLPDAFLFADLDDDGDLDVIAARDNTLSLRINEGGNQHHVLRVRFRGQQVKANEQGASKRVNHYGIGNTVEVKVGRRYQAQIADGQTTRFGIGPAEKADIVRVIATNGVPQNRIEPKANELICERQILLTSCPFLYTWNGEKYEFCTDLLWAAPLGLKASQTELVPWRDWEYLKIDGRQLQPKDGAYLLQWTEELWEAAYLDHVKLFAIDHPAEVQIFTNEKVGGPDLAAHKIHTVRTPQMPVSVRDQAGRDWSTQLAHRDERYTRNWTRKLAQGLCAEHYLEFDLGELASPGKITLFLTGWIRPGDTNLSVAFDQDETLPSPTGLALWTPNASGDFQPVRPHVGFPNGKTKTIAIDLTDAFPAGRFQFRLVSNREFYWDQAFFTVDEEPSEFRERELKLTHADVHFRGFSRGMLPPGDGPETYDYQQPAAIPPWPAIDGMFTRYGDVLPLVTERDDRMVVVGPGDEISLSFAVPADPLPDGWVRDFVIYNVGWDKDCLLNTWEGQRVEPLPFAAMQGHDYWTDRPAETGDYLAYLQTWQTRRHRVPFREFVRHWSAESARQLPDWERRRKTGD